MNSMITGSKSVFYVNLKLISERGYIFCVEHVFLFASEVGRYQLIASVVSMKIDHFSNESL